MRGKSEVETQTLTHLHQGPFCSYLLTTSKFCQIYNIPQSYIKDKKSSKAPGLFKCHLIKRAFPDHTRKSRTQLSLPVSFPLLQFSLQHFLPNDDGLFICLLIILAHHLHFMRAWMFLFTLHSPRSERGSHTQNRPQINRYEVNE